MGAQRRRRRRRLRPGRGPRPDGTIYLTYGAADRCVGAASVEHIGARRRAARGRLKPARLLERRDQSERRLGALVFVHSVRLEPVAAAPADRVEERCADVVGAEEPGGRAQRGLRPCLVVGDVECPGACVRHCRGLDRLLIESRSRLPWCPAADRREAEMVASGFNSDEPREQVKPLYQEAIVAEHCAVGNPCFGEHGVGIGEPSLRPRPFRVGQHASQPGGCSFEQRIGRGGGCGGREECGRAERRERVSARRRGAELRTGLEEGERPLALRGAARQCSGRTGGPERTPCRVVEADSVQPLALDREPIAEAAVGTLSSLEEGEADCGEAFELRRPRRLSHQRDQGAGNVIGAVAVLEARRRQLGVLENADAVTHFEQMLKPGSRKLRRASLGRRPCELCCQREIPLADLLPEERACLAAGDCRGAG